MYLHSPQSSRSGHNTPHYLDCSLTPPLPHLGEHGAEAHPEGGRRLQREGVGLDGGEVQQGRRRRLSRRRRQELLALGGRQQAQEAQFGLVLTLVIHSCTNTTKLRYHMMFFLGRGECIPTLHVLCEHRPDGAVPPALNGLQVPPQVHRDGAEVEAACTRGHLANVHRPRIKHGLQYGRGCNTYRHQSGCRKRRTGTLLTLYSNSSSSASVNRPLNFGAFCCKYRSVVKKADYEHV